jgi:hypothetical protein
MDIGTWVIQFANDGLQAADIIIRQWSEGGDSD